MQTVDFLSMVSTIRLISKTGKHIVETRFYDGNEADKNTKRKKEDKALVQTLPFMILC